MTNGRLLQKRTVAPATGVSLQTIQGKFNSHKALGRSISTVYGTIDVGES